MDRSSGPRTHGPIVFGDREALNRELKRHEELEKCEGLASSKRNTVVQPEPKQEVRGTGLIGGHSASWLKNFDFSKIISQAKDFFVAGLSDVKGWVDGIKDELWPTRQGHEEIELLEMTEGSPADLADNESIALLELEEEIISTAEGFSSNVQEFVDGLTAVLNKIPSSSSNKERKRLINLARDRIGVDEYKEAFKETKFYQEANPGTFSRHRTI